MVQRFSADVIQNMVIIVTHLTSSDRSHFSLHDHLYSVTIKQEL